MAILDQNGNPFNLKQIAEPQTASIAALQHTLVQSHLDGLTPSRAASILREADLGNLMPQAELFDDMMDRDAHLRCEYDKRAGALLGLDWSIEPPPNASKAEQMAAEWVEETLRHAVDDLEDLITAMMDAPGHGFAPIEIEWRRDGQERIPVFHPRPQTWFKTDMTRRELRLNDGSGDGAVPVPMGWVIHQPRKVKTGYLGRAGLFRACLWPFLYKAYGIGDFAEFLEIFGLPIIMGKYMGTPNREEKASLLRAVTALGRDARAIMPESMQIEIAKVTGGSGGEGGGHLAMVAWADGAQSKAILGQVLSAEAKATGMGSGVADLHAEVRHDILVSDARQVAGTLIRDLIYPMVAINRPGIDGLRRCPRWVWDLGEAEDLAAYAENLPKLAAGGVKIPVNWVHERLRIPQAAEDEEVFGVPPSPASGGGAGGEGQGVPPKPAPNQPAPSAAMKTLAVMKAQAQQPPIEDLLAERLAQEADPEIRAWLEDSLLAVVESSQSLEEVREKLLAAFSSLDREALAQKLGDGFAVAHLRGMADVNDE